MFEKVGLDFSTMEIVRMDKKSEIVKEWHKQVAIFSICMIFLIASFVGGAIIFGSKIVPPIEGTVLRGIVGGLVASLPAFFIFMYCSEPDFSEYKDAIRVCKERFGDDLAARKVNIKITNDEEIRNAIKRGFISEDILDLSNDLYFSKELWLPELAMTESRNDLEEYVIREFEYSLEKLEDEMEEDKKEKDINEVNEIIVNTNNQIMKRAK